MSTALSPPSQTKVASTGRRLAIVAAKASVPDNATAHAATAAIEPFPTATIVPTHSAIGTSPQTASTAFLTASVTAAVISPAPAVTAAPAAAQATSSATPAAATAPEPVARRGGDATVRRAARRLAAHRPGCSDGGRRELGRNPQSAGGCRPLHLGDKLLLLLLLVLYCRDHLQEDAWRALRLQRATSTEAVGNADDLKRATVSRGRVGCGQKLTGQLTGCIANRDPEQLAARTQQARSRRFADAPFRGRPEAGSTASLVAAEAAENGSKNGER